MLWTWLLSCPSMSVVLLIGLWNLNSPRVVGALNECETSAKKTQNQCARNTKPESGEWRLALWLVSLSLDKPNLQRERERLVFFLWVVPSDTPLPCLSVGFVHFIPRLQHKLAPTHSRGIVCKIKAWSWIPEVKTSLASCFVPGAWSVLHERRYQTFQRGASCRIGGCQPQLGVNGHAAVCW